MRATLSSILVTVALTACGDDGGDRATTYVPGPVSVISPAHGASYADQAPPIIAVVDPTFSEAQRSSVRATVNGVDVSERLVAHGQSLVAVGLADVVQAGANTVVVSFEGVDHAIGFQRVCEASCKTGKPVILGPDEAVEMSQASLFGSNLGRAGDRRLVRVNGQAAEWFGGHFGGSRMVFVAPPASLGSVTVEVEVNGVRSDPHTITLVAAPPLEDSADSVIAGFTTGMSDVLGAFRALPVLDSGDPETDALTATLRAALETDLARLLADVNVDVAALPDEAKGYLAQFLRQGRLDTLLGGWVADVAKADGVPQGFSEQCEGPVLRVYKLIAYFKVVQDALNGLAKMAAIFAVLVPPAAAWAVLFAKLAADTSTIIGTLELFISTTLPDLVSASIDLPSLVSRSEEVAVHATVTFVYDPTKKVQEVTNWATNGIVGKAIGDLFGALAGGPGSAPALATLSNEAIGSAHALANAMAQKAAGDGGSHAPPFTVPADPLLLDFEAERFELVPSTLPGACQAIGRWKDDQTCEVEDVWTIGENLALTGVLSLVFSESLAHGTVKSANSPVLGANPWDDELWGAALERAGMLYGCSEMERCWNAWSDLGCSPNALQDGPCADMFILGNCPSQQDWDNGVLLCQLCFEGQ